MPGISRINIVSGWNDWRMELARKHAPIADSIYRQIFPLQTGEQSVSVTKNEALARYDWKEGIDVILTFQNGGRATLQEKFLTYKDDTVTFEETKSNGEQGAWYYCTAQYYFVGYSRKYWDYRQRVVWRNPVIGFQSWILIDLPALHRNVDCERLWHFSENVHDGRHSSFRFMRFDDVPVHCVIARN